MQSLEQEVGSWDSVLLENLSENTFISNLQQRYKRDQIYTYIGTFLISINPNKPLKLYTPDIVKAYGTKGLFQLSPHIYAIANTAFRWLEQFNEDQCILLSGESGAGKTETSRMCVHYLTVFMPAEDKSRHRSSNSFSSTKSNSQCNSRTTTPKHQPKEVAPKSKTAGCLANATTSKSRCSHEKTVEFDFSQNTATSSSDSLDNQSTIPLTATQSKCQKHHGKKNCQPTLKFVKCNSLCHHHHLHNSNSQNHETNVRISEPHLLTCNKSLKKSQVDPIRPKQCSCAVDSCSPSPTSDRLTPILLKKSSEAKSPMTKLDEIKSSNSLTSSLRSLHSLQDTIEVNRIREKISQTDVLLEAFGNAITIKNANSSRFGKFFDIEFDFKGDPIGGHIRYYMLEKSRVTHSNVDERNFHIFYQLLAGGDIQFLKSLKLQRNIDKYKLLKHGMATEDDKLNYVFTRKSLDVLEFSGDEIQSIFKIIAVVIKLGNLNFIPSTNIDGTESCTISNEHELREISNLLSLDEHILLNCLTRGSTSPTSSPLFNDHYGAELDAATASLNQEKLCRTLYGRLFTWIINRINESLKIKNKPTRTRKLGILDFYGFEIFQINSFEQLTINYCNERLHQYFLQNVLKYQQEMYARDGLDWIRIDYFDNETICELIDKPNYGILSLLDEQQVTCDEAFCTRVFQCCSGNPNFLSQDGTPRSFQIRHYAGQVVYSVRNFPEKNLDILPKNISASLYKSELSIVQSLFPEGNPKRVVKKPSSIGTTLRTSLTTLLNSISQRRNHYVSCIKPNENKQPRFFDQALIQHQVRCMNLMPLVNLWRSGHYFHMIHGKFFARYKLLSPNTWPHFDEGSLVEGIIFILRCIPLPMAEFTIGRTNVFIRSPRALFELEELRQSRIDDLATFIQKIYRGYSKRKRFLRMRQCQIIIASAWRTWRECRFGISFKGRKHLWGLYRIAREEYRIMRYRKQVDWAVGVIQRQYIKWKRRQFLNTLPLRLPPDSLSPLCFDWPVASLYLTETSQLLRNIYHRWRCSKYRIAFDQTSRNRMREKVTASIIFKDRKASYLKSVSHPFLGDYVRLRQNVQWKKISIENNDQYVVFADIINKITRSSGKFVPILLVLSTSSMLLLDQRTLQVKYRVPATEIYRLSLSPYLDDIAVFHVKADPLPSSNHISSSNSTGCLFQSELGRKKGDFVFQTGHVIEIVTKLFLVIQNATSKPPEVHISTEFEANFGQQTVLFTFKCGGLAEVVQHGQPKITRKPNRMEVIV